MNIEEYKKVLKDANLLFDDRFMSTYRYNGGTIRTMFNNLQLNYYSDTDHINLHITTGEATGIEESLLRLRVKWNTEAKLMIKKLNNIEKLTNKI